MCQSYHPLSTAAPRDGDVSFTRREFLYTGLAMVSTVASVPGFLTRSGRALAAPDGALASRPGVPDDRVLVVVQLSGGNDGLNTVVPFGFDEYHRARPGIGVRAQDAIALDTTRGIGLHPNLADLADMVHDGLAGIVQGVGYPNPNRSHFASMDIWHAGDTRDTRGRGWLGRALDHADDTDRLPDKGLACIGIGGEAPPATRGERVQPVTFERADLFRWAGSDLHPALGDTYRSLQAPGNALPEDDPASFLFRTAMDAQVASDRVRRAVAGRTSTRFPANALARQLEMVAKMIRAELPTRVYYVATSGFDTHATQNGSHPRLLREFAQAMRAFYRELDATGHRRRVLSLAFSEFGRRVRQNASGGTDHGAAGPMFVFGDAVQPGLIGEHPSLTDLDGGDLKHRIDFRGVYADVLDGWMKLDSAAALGRRFAPAGVLRA